MQAPKLNQKTFLPLVSKRNAVIWQNVLVCFIKAYLHSRMRARTAEFIKVLNRAKPEQKTTEKKTVKYVIRV